MVHSPSVLVLDEPAAGLDPRARIELREMIGGLAADGTTVLISSHILTELAEMCDCVGIIEQGELLATGTVDEIQNANRQHRVVKAQVLDRTAELGQWLENHPELSDVHCDTGGVTFSHTGRREHEAELLKEMIVEGFSIVEFGSHVESLEDVFLHVTEGRIQ